MIVTEKEQISDVTGRVTEVEVNLSNLTGNVNRLTESWERQSNKINTELDKLSDQFSSFVAKVGRPDWAVIGMLGGGLITLLTAVGGMAIAPLYLIYIFQNSQIKEAHDWQVSYMKGDIPSSAKGDIDRVASDLHSFEARMAENENWIVKLMDRQYDHIDRLEQKEMTK